MKKNSFFLIFAIVIFILSGCSKHVMDFNPHRLDDKLRHKHEKKKTGTVLILSDNEVKQILCVNAPSCNKLKKFIKTGEVTNKLSNLFYGQYYNTVHSIPKDEFEHDNLDYTLIVYPKILDYKYTVEYKNVGFMERVVVDMTMSIQAFDNNGEVIFEKVYTIDDAKSQFYFFSPRILGYLQKVLYRSIFDVLNQARVDLMELRKE